ncbi:hypothetical protein CPT03_21780 [Pedobacter ginsengisoli]|uniref:Uncharacterized protein n=1 Tax=Pedobacter ginsengisoli TaxID=363852 RepID=A0A2D1UBF0_9SPHI|nr:hypothetical protein [Pedobacter ginsengisoli]ATP58909.1 hypothetical protein CPT03_21780 [Pedobacter ginsengisoli]
MKKFTLNLKICLSVVICLLFMGYSKIKLLDEQTSYIQQLLVSHYNEEPEIVQVKHYELNVTNSGFCRYKRFFKSGKVEYFSFNLVKFKDLDYKATDTTGALFLYTKGDDVIVQTYNDKNEDDVDSMANYMSIPVKNIKGEELTELSDQIRKANVRLLAQK